MPTEKSEVKTKQAGATPSEKRHALQRAARSPLSLIFNFIVFPAFVVGAIYLQFSNHNFINCLLREDCSTIEYRAQKILRENPLIADGHNDLFIVLRALYGNHVYGDSFKDKFENGGLEQHTDIPRLEAGLSGGAFWSAFEPCPANGSDFSDANYAPIVKATLEQLDLYHRLGQAYPKYFTPTLTAADARRSFKERGFISPVIIEGLHQIGNSISTLRLFHQLGVRYATLTWNCHNIFADAAITINEKNKGVKSSPKWGGVSEAGRVLIEEMNRLGMIVDLSHVSVDTMADVLSGTKDGEWAGSIAPPIFSHSSAYALCPHPRNVPDEILQLVKLRKAVVLVNFNPDFISCTPSNDGTGIPELYKPNNTLNQVVRHIRHIGELIGYDYVGLGTDYDGIEGTPEGLEDVSKFPDLVAELLRQGVSDADVAKIVGLNVLRVWDEVDAVAEKLQKERLPAEDEIVIFPEGTSEMHV
ncbi:membrane dipeptidase-domain-containing protein [Phyllosticta capitalensis]